MYIQIDEKYGKLLIWREIFGRTVWSMPDQLRITDAVLDIFQVQNSVLLKTKNKFVFSVFFTYFCQFGWTDSGGWQCRRESYLQGNLLVQRLRKHCRLLDCGDLILPADQLISNLLAQIANLILVAKSIT